MIVVIILAIIAVTIYALYKNKNDSNSDSYYQPQPKSVSTPIVYNLPNGINRALNSLNPYRNKYRENTTADALYLLYCDYSTSDRWIHDAIKPDVFFTNYIKAIQLLETIVEREQKPQKPKQQLHSLKFNYTHNVNLFVSRYYNAILEESNKLKTEKGKQNRLQKFFDTLLNEYSSYLLNENIAFINSYRNKSIPEPAAIIKQPVMCGGYNVSTISNIEGISNTNLEVMRLLQKAATAHKRNGDIELAIACLKKSNEISDKAPRRQKLTEKEYLRVLRYINLLKNPELSETEEKIVKRKHPEFWDKRISNKRKIREAISNCKRSNTDLIVIHTRSSCPICSQHNRTVYSISGTHRIYPKLPDEVLNQTHNCKECIWSASPFYEGISTINPMTPEEMAEMDRRRNKTHT